MKIKKTFNFKRAWNFYKEDQEFQNKKEAKAAFLFGCAAALHLTTEEVGGLKSLEKQFKALSYMKDQADAIFDGEDESESGLPEDLADILKQVFEKIGARVEVEKSVFDMRDEDVLEKFEATLKERREKMERLKAEGNNFGFEVKGQHFNSGQIDEGLNFARDEFYKDFARKNELIKEREETAEKQKAAGEALSQAGDLLKDRKKEAASLADDVQKETPKEYGDRTEYDCREKLNEVLSESDEDRAARG